MGLVVKPPQFTATTLTVSAINTLMNTVYDEFGATVGSGGTGAGNIQDANVASNAAIAKSKVADVAVVCTNTVSAGTQTITRPTSFGSSAFRMDISAANTGTLPTGATPAIDQTKYVWKTANTGATSITAITGGVAGQEIMLVINEAFTTIVHDAGTPIANNEIKLEARANYAASANWPSSIVLRYGDPTGSGFNVWWQV